MSLCRWTLLGLACLVMAGCTSTDWESRYRDKERQATELGSDLEVSRHDMAKLQAGNQVLTDQLARTRSENERLADEIAAMRGQLANAASAPVEVAPAVDIQALKRKMEFGDIKLDDSGNVVITLESGITFASGSATLSASGRSILGRVVATLRSEFPDRQIRLVGHTDTDPIKRSGFKDNWSLGFERARAVAVYFRDEGKVAADRLSLSSRGEYQPLAGNESASGKKKNRRVEVVVVMPKGDLSAYR